MLFIVTDFAKSYIYDFLLCFSSESLGLSIKIFSTCLVFVFNISFAKIGFFCQMYINTKTYFFAIGIGVFAN